jgi:hypothetical protein
MIRRIEEHPRQNQEGIRASGLWRNLPFLPGPWKQHKLPFPPYFPSRKLEMIQKIKPPARLNEQRLQKGWAGEEAAREILWSFMDAGIR